MCETSLGDVRINVQALMVVKDEADVVFETIRSAHQWASGIHVLDNGSTDGTWEIIQECSRRFPCVKVVGRSERVFHDSVRAEVFQMAKGVARSADWWMRLDADEIYAVDPRPTLAAIPRWYDAVLGSMYQFYLTDLDVMRIEEDPDSWGREPLVQRVRWYRNNWAELRFVRASITSRWTDTAWPEGTHRISPMTIPIRHYQYRSPAQITQRVRSRMLLPEFVHEQARRPAGESQEPHWERVIEDHCSLDYDDGYGPLIARHHAVPGFRLRMRRQVGYVARRAGASRLRRLIGRLAPARPT